MRFCKNIRQELPLRSKVWTKDPRGTEMKHQLVHNVVKVMEPKGFFPEEKFLLKEEFLCCSVLSKYLPDYVSLQMLSKFFLGEGDFHLLIPRNLYKYLSLTVLVHSARLAFFDVLSEETLLNVLVKLVEILRGKDAANSYFDLLKLNGITFKRTDTWYFVDCYFNPSALRHNK